MTYDPFRNPADPAGRLRANTTRWMSGSVTYEITDAEGTDLLGCEQPDADTARLAAGTLVEDGHTLVSIWRLVDGEREQHPRATAFVSGQTGNVEIRGYETL